jgi:hypothetical protein
LESLWALASATASVDTCSFRCHHFCVPHDTQKGHVLLEVLLAICRSLAVGVRMRGSPRRNLGPELRRRERRSIGRHASAGVLLAICRYSLGRCWWYIFPRDSLTLAVGVPLRRVSRCGGISGEPTKAGVAVSPVNQRCRSLAVVASVTSVTVSTPAKCTPLGVAVKSVTESVAAAGAHWFWGPSR